MRANNKDYNELVDKIFETYRLCENVQDKCSPYTKPINNMKKNVLEAFTGCIYKTKKRTT